METFPDFLKVKAGKKINLIRFSAIIAVEIDYEEQIIYLTISEQQEKFALKCSSLDVFRGYLKYLDRALHLGLDPQKELLETKSDSPENQS